MAHKTQRTEYFVVQNAILSFPKLFVPEQVAGKGEPKFTTALIVDNATGEMLNNKARELAQKAFPNGEWQLPNFRLPCSNTNDKFSVAKGTFLYRDNPITANKMVFNVTSDQTRPPKIVGGNPLQDITDRSQIYAGAIVAVNMSMYTFSNSGNIGVAVGFDSVLKMGDGQALGDSAPPVNVEIAFAGIQAAPLSSTTPAGSTASSVMPTNFGAQQQYAPQQVAQSVPQAMPAFMQQQSAPQQVAQPVPQGMPAFMQPTAPFQQ